MKSTIKQAQTQKQESFSPGLYIFKGGELIVYFLCLGGAGYASGLAIVSGNGRIAGDFRHDWIFDSFERFNGVIELSND